MEVRFYINENVVRRPEFKAELDSLNVRYKYKEIPGIGNKEGWKYVQFDISENDPFWPTIRDLLARHGLKAGRRMNYSKRDIETAEWLRFRPDSQSLGYPKNQHLTYHQESICARCGICEQIAPFRLSSEPKTNTKHFFGIGWIHEEVFARLEVQNVFERLGITGLEYLRPVKHRTGKPFEIITQLKVNTVLPAALFTEECEPVTCCENNEEGQNQPANRLTPLITAKELTAKVLSGEIGPYEYGPADIDWSGIPPNYPCCGRVKYHVIYKHQAKFSRKAFKDAPDFVKTNEWFGTWHHAGRETLISRRAAHIILENKWRGVRLEPIALI
jgi:hypothetical protein